MNWLREKRNEKNLKQEQIAAAVGIERAYYSLIENGKRMPSVKVAKGIADYMNFDWTMFYNFDNLLRKEETDR